ncbi:hypothetical protein EDB86DRAFT_3242154, partial [Lactarius hatsudake]
MLPANTVSPGLLPAPGKVHHAPAYSVPSNCFLSYCCSGVQATVIVLLKSTVRSPSRPPPSGSKA